MSWVANSTWELCLILETDFAVERNKYSDDEELNYNIVEDPKGKKNLDNDIFAFLSRHNGFEINRCD